MKVVWESLVKGAVVAGIAASAAAASIDIAVKTDQGVKKISPYLYGRNIGGVSDTDPTINSDEQAVIDKMLEAGIHFLRANDGNNATRYNWRKKLSAHPDWYNNVNAHDWDITAQKVQQNMPGVDAMYAFQLTGYAASTKENNFPDWDFYQEHGYWADASLDLSGGGEVTEDGKTLIKAGDYRLYTESWPADSTVGIIPHWKDELQYDMNRLKYWSMDNEMDIWMSTHNDLPLQVTPEFLVERYVDVAKKARAAWKDIKLTGPVVANEWQWCSVSTVTESGLGKGPDRDYCWLEYFIKEVAAAQKASGVRLLDVLDIHWYPSEKSYEDRINWYRVLFDTTYNYPGANGIKMVNGYWDGTITKSYIFTRINQWLDKYFGEGHGITLGITETALDADDPMVTAITYASFLGTMGDNGVEIFTPWSWSDGMYEVVHLFSRYGHGNRVLSQSSNDSLVSAYSSINNKGDSLTVILVNRAENQSQEVNLSLPGFSAEEGNAATLTLADIKGETFESHSQNALRQGNVSVANDQLTLTLPAKSIVAVLLNTTQPKDVAGIKQQPLLGAVALKVQGKRIQFASQGKYALSNVMGQVVSQGMSNGNVELVVPQAGLYILRVGGENYKVTVK